MSRVGNEVRRILSGFYTAPGVFDHEAFLTEMERVNGGPLTKIEQRQLAQIVAAYVRERTLRDVVRS